MSEELKPCPLCGGTNVTCFAEYDGDSYENEPIYRAVVGCLGCHEEGCDPSYDDEPCFGIEAYFRADHPLIREEEDPSDCERVLERHMAERWNRRAERTCTIVRGDGEFPHCSSCGSLEVASDVAGAYDFCPRCGRRLSERGM